MQRYPHISIFSIFLSALLLQACSSSNDEHHQIETSSVSANQSIEFQDKKTYAIESDGVYASNELNGSRLNDFIRIGENQYKAIIRPESSPINGSSYFAFQLWSTESKTVTLSLKYTEHKHRYIPKVSRDGQHWQRIPGVILSEGDSLATFKVDLTEEKLWVAAQEVISSQDTYDWVDQLIESRDFLSKEIAGKTALSKPMYVLSAEQEKLKPSAVLIARQHPPESPGGTFAFKGFLTELLSSSYLATEFRSKFNLYVFPVMNPDSIDLGHWRFNANGADLNRDWEAFEQPETQVVRDFLRRKVEKENKSIVFGIDFHTSYNGPYLLILRASLKTTLLDLASLNLASKCSFIAYKLRFFG